MFTVRKELSLITRAFFESGEDLRMDLAKTIRPVFSHFYNPKRQPAVTVCYLDDGDKGTAIGMAICSPTDNPNKSCGRSIALERAAWALSNMAHITEECDLPGVGYDASRVNRIPAVTSLYRTDFSAWEGEKILQHQGVFKILYVGTPGFRYKRIQTLKARGYNPTGEESVPKASSTPVAEKTNTNTQKV